MTGLIHYLRGAAFVGALLLSAGTSYATAQEHLKLADGTTLSGDATAYDEAMKVVSFTTDDGRDMLLRIDELDQRSAYMLAKSQVDKSSGADELKFANFARDIGLYAHAARHYRNALELDPALKPQVEAGEAQNRALAATWALGKAKAEADKGNMHSAERWLTQILQKLPNEKEAAQAAQWLEEYHAKKSAEQEAKLKQKDEELFEKELKRGKQYYDQMLERNRQGLQESPASSTAIKKWESAIKSGDRALHELDRVAKKIDDPGVQETLQSYREHVTEEIIEIYTNMASALTNRTSFQQAMSAVNKALAIDPKSTSAISMRSRVEGASSRSGRIWW